MMSHYVFLCKNMELICLDEMAVMMGHNISLSKNMEFFFFGGGGGGINMSQ